MWHHLTMVTEGQGMQALPVDQSEQLPGSISICDVNRHEFIQAILMSDLQHKKLILQLSSETLFCLNTKPL